MPGLYDDVISGFQAWKQANQQPGEDDGAAFQRYTGGGAAPTPIPQMAMPQQVDTGGGWPTPMQDAPAGVQRALGQQQAAQQAQDVVAGSPSITGAPFQAMGQGLQQGIAQAPKPLARAPFPQMDQPPRQQGPGGGGGGLGFGAIGELGKIEKQMGGIAGAGQERSEKFLAPYRAPEGTPAIPGMPGTSAALDRASLLEEYQTLHAKPDRSLAELNRMNEITAGLSAQTAQEKAGKEFQIQQQGEQALQEQQKRDAESAAFRKQEVEKETGKLTSAIQDIQNSKEDPERLLSAPGGMFKFIGAVLLGAIAQGMRQSGRFGDPNARNVGLDAVNQAIERDLQAQRADLEKKKGLVGMRQGALAMMRDKFADDAQAENAARVAMQAETIRRLSLIGAQYKGTEAGDAALSLQAQMIDNMGRTVQTFAQGADAIAQQNLHARAGVKGTQAGLGLQAEQINLARQQAEAKAGSKQPMEKGDAAKARQITAKLDQLNGIEQRWNEHAGSTNYLARKGLPQPEWNAYIRGQARTLAGIGYVKGEPREPAVDDTEYLLPAAGETQSHGQTKIQNMKQRLFTEMQSMARSAVSEGRALPPEMIDLLYQKPTR